MFQPKNYFLTEQIYYGDHSSVYKATKTKNNKKVIIKYLKENYPSPSELSSFHKEFEITRDLNDKDKNDCIIKVFQINRYRNSLFIELEDFGGLSVSKILPLKEWDINFILNLFIDISKAVSFIHMSGIIHKDINSSNIIINTETNKVKIIDFGISTFLSQEKKENQPPSMLEGTLAYMSPEQTGRINRAIDHRTDLYSMGVTFYEILTGKLPFFSTDPAELVHCHLAKNVVAPREVDNKIPAQLSNVIMKLLSKNTEDRYQSTNGLIYDLKKIQEHYLSSNENNLFVLGEHDISDKFQLSQKLYGREFEIEKLLNLFRKVSNGKTELIFIKGYSGVGKSALVHELNKPVTEKKGFFLFGKFEQFNKTLPYSAFIKAYQSLVRNILKENKEYINYWKNRLTSVLYPNAQLIIDVIPDLHTIIGDQPSIPELSQTELQNLFKKVFQDFVRIFANEDHPILIFLDDLQWADSASLKLINIIASDQESKHILIVGTYRDNEVNVAHPLILTMNEIKSSGIEIHEILIKPLHLDNVRQFLLDSFTVSSQNIEDLALITYEKTKGNPFFIIQFINNLYKNNYLWFDSSAKEWHWNLEKIKGIDYSDNVVNLVINKYQQMKKSSRDILKYAASIGNYFDLKTLSVLYEENIETISKALMEALEELMILPMDNEYRYVGLYDNLNANYRFIHDRVQQAIYSQIPVEQRQQLHLKIGKHLFENFSNYDFNKMLFVITNHLNEARSLIDNNKEKIELAKLNLQAGIKAKHSNAYDSAIEFTSIGISLLDEYTWDQNYELCFSLHLEHAEAHYLGTYLDKAEKLFNSLLKKSKYELDKTKIYEMNIDLNTVLNRFNEAVENGLGALRVLNININSNPDFEFFKENMNELNHLLGTKNIETLIDLPEMSDPNMIAAIRILLHTWTPAYVGGNMLLSSLLVVESVKISLIHGNGPGSPFAYSMYGLILSAGFNDFTQGFEYGLLSLSLMEKMGLDQLKCRINFNFAVFVNHWKNSLQTGLPYLKEAIKSGQETGDLQYGSYAINNFHFHSMFKGENLFNIEESLENFTIPMLKTKQIDSIQWFFLFKLFINSLLNKSENIFKFISPDFDEDKIIPSWTNIGGLNIYYTLKCILYFLFDKIELAIESAENAEKHIAGTTGMIFRPQLYLFYSLSLISKLKDEQDSEIQSQLLSQINKNLEILKPWADNSPINYGNKYRIIKTELESYINKNSTFVVGEYNACLDYAISNENKIEEAICNELLAKHYIYRSLPKIAELYIQDAYHSYINWGAISKIEFFQSKYKSYLDLSQEKIKHPSTKKTITTTAAGSLIDLSSAIKASNIISSELEMKNLLKKLIEVVMENAGAEKAILILPKENQLFIEAECSINQGIRSVLASIPLKDYGSNLSESIIHYAVNLKEIVVLDNAHETGDFISDEYISENQIKSVLCIPIFKQNKLIAILYFENNFNENNFNEKRVELLKLLTSQISISVENARLIENLKEQERLKKEMEIAQKIQIALLPKLHKHNELDIYAQVRSADEIGGDYFDIHYDKSHRLWFAIGDVSGHGLNSGLIMMMTQSSLITSLTENETLDPKQAIEATNRLLCTNVRERMKENQFMTMCLLRYDGDGFFTHAGVHEDILVYRAKTRTFDYIKTEGIFLSIKPDISKAIKNRIFHLDYGDLMLLYSDGITEAKNSEKEMFGMKKVKKIITSHIHMDVKEISDKILQEVLEWCNNAHQDDITMILVRKKIL